LFDLGWSEFLVLIESEPKLQFAVLTGFASRYAPRSTTPWSLIGRRAATWQGLGDNAAQQGLVRIPGQGCGKPGEWLHPPALP